MDLKQCLLKPKILLKAVGEVLAEIDAEVKALPPYDEHTSSLEKLHLKNS